VLVKNDLRIPVPVGEAEGGVGGGVWAATMIDVATGRRMITMDVTIQGSHLHVMRIVGEVSHSNRKKSNIFTFVIERSPPPRGRSNGDLNASLL
jgi:hypothetical protein